MFIEQFPSGVVDTSSNPPPGEILLSIPSSPQNSRNPPLDYVP
jgi:hypothetical protein